MNSAQLKQQRVRLVQEMTPLAFLKTLTSEERVRWSKLETDIRKLDYEILVCEQQEENTRLKAEGYGSDRDLRRYSLSRAIHLRASGKPLDGIELEMCQEAERENKNLGFAPIRGIGMPSMLRFLPLHKRASSGQNATTAADGKNLIQEEPLLFLDGLRNALVLPGMGAHFLTGLVGDLPISIGGTFTSSWLAEDSVASTTKMTFGRKTLTPKRLQAVGALSYQLLRQSSIDVESIVQASIIDAIAQAIQTASINGSGVAPEPKGILQTADIGSVVGGTDGGAPTWAKVLELETAVAEKNAMFNVKYASYLVNAKVKGKLMGTFKNATYGEIPVWGKGTDIRSGDLNGYPAIVTNAVPSDLTKGSSSGVCSAILFGLWNQLYIGQWGGYDIIVDPYTLSDKAETKLTVICYVDSIVGHPESFAAMLDAITT